MESAMDSRISLTIVRTFFVCDAVSFNLLATSLLLATARSPSRCSSIWDRRAFCACPEP